MTAEQSIASCGRSCYAAFERLCSVWPSTDTEIMSQVSVGAIETERSRYHLWVNNIAALQYAYLPSSLEYRIRDDANARKTIMDALTYLDESLQLALSIGSGERPNETWDEPALPSSQANEGIESQSSEIVELYLSIQEAITSLFKLSMIIRKKPEADEYVKAASRYQIDPIHDIVHVADKYPTAKKHEIPWLMERLGVAITRRRQYLIFRREHQERMLQSHRMRAGPDGNTIWSGTKASTYLPNEQFVIDEKDPVKPIKITIDSSQKRPRTEYADSSRGKDGATVFLRTPLLPIRRDGTRAMYGEHFECPYCWRLQQVHDKSEWKKHVLSDLKPYVCTFQPCDLNMFDSQHDWFTHELNFHREQWHCNFCKHQAPKSRPNLIIHIQSEHQEALNGQSVDSLLESCRIDRIDATACPLCEEYGEKMQKINQFSKCDVSLKQFQQHLGIHMQQLALAALPQENHDEDAENLDDEDDESDEFGDMWQKKGIIIYDFMAIGDDQVTVTAGDEVVIIDDTKGGQWCKVRQLKTGKEGYIPSSHVKMGGILSNLNASKISDGSSTIEKEAESKDEKGAGDETQKNAEVAEAEEEREYEEERNEILASLVEAEKAGRENPESQLLKKPELLRKSLWDTGEDKGKTKELVADGMIVNKEAADEALPTTNKKKPILFKDAVGRKYSFPFHLCQTWAGMHTLIKEAFLHVVDIGPHVADGHYDLVGPNGEIILPQVWETMIEPGWAITMHMWPIPEQPETALGSEHITSDTRPRRRARRQPLPRRPPTPPPGWIGRPPIRTEPLPSPTVPTGGEPKATEIVYDVAKTVPKENPKDDRGL